MSDWTSGYVADIGYTFGYYTELNPLRAKLAFLNAGFKKERKRKGSDPIDNTSAVTKEQKGSRIKIIGDRPRLFDQVP